MSNATLSSSPLHPLITQNLVETKKYYCPFLDRGFCREISRCNFSHEHQSSIKIPNDYCHFYLANQCLYGQECKFRHCEPTAQPPTSSSTSIALTSIPFFEQFLASSSSTSSATANNLEGEDVNYNLHQQQPLSPCNRSDDESVTYVTEELFDEPTGHDAVDGDQDGLVSLANGYSGLCPYRQMTLVCDLCGRACLHPYDLEQQRQHREDCLKEHEREMELSFAVQRSKDKVCGICMDTVVEKKPITSSRFGILEKCSHIFCLDCIRKWRGTKQFETRTIRACPECRVSSDFVVPSKYWIEDQDDKDRLINDYKAALRSKPCKYFNEGKGECPFAGSCFYKHAYPDGRIATSENPKPKRKYYGSRWASSSATNYILFNILASTDGEEWSDIDIESLYLDPGATDSDDDYDDDDDDIDDDDDDISDDDVIDDDDEDDINDNNDTEDDNNNEVDNTEDGGANNNIQHEDEDDDDDTLAQTLNETLRMSHLL